MRVPGPARPHHRSRTARPYHPDVPQDEADLRAAWRRWLPGVPDDIIARYREPHRRYHGVRHLAFVVRDVTRLLTDVAVPDPAAVMAAAFLHDAVYDPRSSTNEEASARLADTVLLDWEPSRRADVQRLVLVTVAHDADDPAAAVLSDADLAVLGAEPGAYDAYRRGVRAEYSHVPDDAWRTGRASILRSFLDRPVIFRTPTMHRREARARANLTAELASLARQ